MKEFSLILPTRERPHLVHKLFASIARPTRNLASLEIILYIDDDDTQSAAIEYPGLDIVKIVRPRKVTMGRITQICFEASRGRYISLANDDIIIRTPGWDEKIRKEFQKYPDEVVMIYPNDHYYGKKMCTFPIVTRKTGELMEGICPAQYESHCIDAHIYDVFKRLSQKGFARAVYVNSVVFEHMQIGLGAHVYDGAVGASPNDRLDQQRYIALTPDRERVATRMAKEILRFKKSISSDQAGRRSKITVFVFIPSGLSYDRITTFLASLIQSPYDAPFIEKIALFSRRRNFDALQLPVRFRNIVSHEQLAENENFAERVNQVAQNAGTDFFLFLDAQSAPGPGFVESCVKVFENTAIGATGPSWIDPRTFRFHQQGIDFMEQQGKICPVSLYRGLRTSESFIFQPREFQVLPGNGLMTRRSVFQELNGFSPTSACGSIPMDFICRMRLIGANAVMNPDAVLYCSMSSRLQTAPFFTLTPDQLRQFLKLWKDHLKLSATDILAQDGFELQMLNDARFMTPSAGFIQRLKDTGRRVDSVRWNHNSASLRRFIKASKSSPDGLTCEMTLSPK